MEISNYTFNNNFHNNQSNKKEANSDILDTSFENVLDVNEEYEMPEEYKKELDEKMSNKKLLDGVTYNPYTDKYTLILDDYGVEKRDLERYHISINDNVTKIVSDKPITKEYLEERYQKIQHFFDTEYYDLRDKVNKDNKILEEIGINTPSWISQRDSWGIVKIDGEYLEIDADEFKKHYQIFINKQAYENIQEEHDLGTYHKELNGKEVSFENAKEFEYYVNNDNWKGDHINSMYRKISLAVNLGLIEEGDQNLFYKMYQTEKASYIFKDIENEIFSQSILNSIGSDNSTVYEVIFYEYIFGTEPEFFQNKLNEFVKELENNPEKYPSSNSEFKFDGNINFDKNSSEEYKKFITNTLIDFIQKQKEDFIDKYNYTDESDEIHFLIVAFDKLIDNIKNEKENI
ncbi:hypothetical protein CRV01_00495 [Arcobacter sp. CECT 8983]|uniref:hypothetical protein n=1 Tax=Arcobacter sp. CECT 8983 TaxID=2044508 RepID=UPI00100C3476|nr:hypothetical protein [Arcobacter sp. CECT 8983]RXJ91606.1 hypothetical protein CRV01_00495 [Arcobacter sp. CECT 8983]